jgi:hypothetical protein
MQQQQSDSDSDSDSETKTINTGKLPKEVTTVGHDPTLCVDFIAWFGELPGIKQKEKQIIIKQANHTVKAYDLLDDMDCEVRVNQIKTSFIQSKIAPLFGEHRIYIAFDCECERSTILKEVMDVISQKSKIKFDKFNVGSRKDDNLFVKFVDRTVVAAFLDKYEILFFGQKIKNGHFCGYISMSNLTDYLFVNGNQQPN